MLSVNWKKNIENTDKSERKQSSNLNNEMVVIV